MNLFFSSDFLLVQQSQMLKDVDDCQSVIRLFLRGTYYKSIMVTIFEALFLCCQTEKKGVWENTIKMQEYSRTGSVNGWVTCTGFSSRLRSLSRKRSWKCLHSWISPIWNKTTSPYSGEFSAITNLSNYNLVVVQYVSVLILESDHYFVDIPVSALCTECVIGQFN